MNEHIQPVFTELLWLILGGLLGSVVAFGVLLQLSRKRDVNPLLAAMPPVLWVGCLVLGGLAASWNDDVYTGVMAALLLRVLGAFIIPLALGGYGAALSVLALGQDRHRLAMVWVALVAGSVAVATVVEGSVGGNLVLGQVRGVLVLGLGVSTAFAAGGPLRRTGLAAAMILPFGVGLLEGASQALVRVIAMVQSVQNLPVTHRAEGLQQMLASVAAEIPFGQLALGLSLLAPVGVWVLGARRDPSARSTGMVLLLLIVAFAAYGLGLPGLPELEAAARSRP